MFEFVQDWKSFSKFLVYGGFLNLESVCLIEFFDWDDSFWYCLLFVRPKCLMEVLLIYIVVQVNDASERLFVCSRDLNTLCVMWLTVWWERVVNRLLCGFDEAVRFGVCSSFEWDYVYWWSFCLIDSVECYLYIYVDGMNVCLFRLVFMNKIYYVLENKLSWRLCKIA